jgi:Predicted ATPases of PP-loop superfamily
MEKKFVASYSGGKDGVFAIYKAIQQGMKPLALITTFNTDQNRSWFHGIPEQILENAAESMGIPIWLIKTSGDEYEKNFEKNLISAKEQGAEACVFGDIDIEEHIKWCTDRCVKAGIEPVFPLCGHSREAVVHDFIDSGFTAHFTIINKGEINENFLGKVLTKELLREIETQGADICGENGEYHTFVFDGPLFKKPVEFEFGEKIVNNERVMLPVQPI